MKGTKMLKSNTANAIQTSDENIVDSADSADSADDASVSVVIVTYRNTAVIAPCLNAVAEITTSIPMEVIVVDNASPDDTVDVARAAAPQAKIIKQSQNGGFADGCAAGATVARGRWLLFLNPDTLIAADAVDALLDCAARHPGVGIIGGRFAPYGSNINPSSWWGKPTLWSTFCFASGLSTVLAGNRFFDPETPRPWGPTHSEVRVVPVISGAFMLVRRDLWERLGGFDRTFFMYGEDADFCLRAAKAGEKSVVSAKAVCQHAGGKSSSSAWQTRPSFHRQVHPYSSSFSSRAAQRRHWVAASWCLSARYCQQAVWSPVTLTPETINSLG